jgi:enoyl-CoA hydratase/carnithine racemase
MSVLVRREKRSEGGHLARLTIDNAAKMNSLNRALMTDIIEATAALASDQELRLVIVTGAGERAFVGGADIAEIAALDRDSARSFITSVHRCCDAFRRLPVPVIARIDGYALGAGLELACACDLRIASEQSVFGMPEVKIGIPSVVEAALLPKLIGQGRARRLLLTGETIGAAEALDWGLVDVVAPHPELDQAVEALLHPILAAGPNAIRLQKALILDWEELPIAAAIERGVDCFVDAFDTDEPARMANAMLAELHARRQPKD